MVSKFNSTVNSIQCTWHTLGTKQSKKFALMDLISQQERQPINKKYNYEY
jgi:hypothetical protein